jgi:hypothetical protein
MLNMLVNVLFPHKWVTFGTLLILLGLLIPLLMTAGSLTATFPLFFLTLVLIAVGVTIRLLGCCFYLGETALEG